MIKIKRNLCDRCGTCIAICPANCISLSEAYLEINNEQCLKCKKCTWICPLGALEMEEEKE